MSTLYQIPDLRFQFGDTAYPPTSDTVWGTHISHWGAGGYMEVPTQADLYGIPLNAYLEANTYMSGRRKIGMIVYVIELNKFFQLRPRNKTTSSYLTLSEYDALTPDEEKLTVLDPMASYSVRIDGARVTIAGTGNPADCWTELCLDCGGGLEFLDVYTDATLTSLSANKIIHFHTTSTMNLTVSMDFDNVDSVLQCSPGFNTAVMNAGAGMLTLSGVKGVSTVLDAENSGAFIYVKSPGDAYAVGRL